MNIAIIPARGGSKRIPHKNIKEFGGKPMIAWSIKAALESSIFDRIVVSTDDPRIAEISRKVGAEVPFMRPAELSDDHTTTIPVIRHAIDQLDLNPENICCIYATAPLLQAHFIRKGLDILSNCKNDGFAFSATTFPFPIQRGFYQFEDKIQMAFPEHAATRSQDLPIAYHDAGQFYWGTEGAWKTHNSVFTRESKAVIIPRHLAQDIDDDDDWVIAEKLFQRKISAESINKSSSKVGSKDEFGTHQNS
jgi:pseudaminic acid cytidylyltransferase